MTEYEKMIRLLDMSWYMRKQIVPCLVGPPGIGKTAAVEQHARAHNSKVIKIVASRCIPSETVGMTMPDHENRSMEIYNSMQLSSLNDGDILFLDELLEAEQYVLSTLLTVIESREMADGTPLPDIQIIAATNDTISPEQLKGNIRQRFMFQRFRVDGNQTREYILNKTGIDIPPSLIDKLSANGTDYNFLTPRSLTKLCLWIDSIPEDKLDDIGQVINEMWNSMIGFDLVTARRQRDAKLATPEQQIRKAVKEILDDKGDDFPYPDLDFNDCTMNEMLELLQSLPDWDDIASKLSQLEIKEEEKQEADITF